MRKRGEFSRRRDSGPVSRFSFSAFVLGTSCARTFAGDPLGDTFIFPRAAENQPRDELSLVRLSGELLSVSTIRIQSADDPKNWILLSPTVHEEVMLWIEPGEYVVDITPTGPSAATEWDELQGDNPDREIALFPVSVPLIGPGGTYFIRSDVDWADPVEIGFERGVRYRARVESRYIEQANADGLLRTSDTSCLGKYPGEFVSLDGWCWELVRGARPGRIQVVEGHRMPGSVPVYRRLPEIGFDRVDD